MEKTIELIQIQQETLQDVIQYLDRINHRDRKSTRLNSSH